MKRCTLHLRVICTRETFPPYTKCSKYLQSEKLAISISHFLIIKGNLLNKSRAPSPFDLKEKYLKRICIFTIWSDG
eukprot:UN27286